jgi:XTP/dITP diphosphohydrolase
VAPPTLIIGTTNPGKAREFRELLAGLPIALLPLAELSGRPPDVAEDGPTYRDNAVKKALSVARWAGHAALADDSGLEVDALGGAPGVHSARYAGTPQDSGANIVKLLAALAGTPPEQRTARFRCVIAMARPDGRVLVAEGTCEGRITETPNGRAGFGYDPIFFSSALGRTFAEAAPAVKNGVSHRAQACRVLRSQLVEFLARS